MSQTPVVVIGAGPAALASAGACARRGLDVALVAPAVERPWTANYAVWSDEIADLEAGGGVLEAVEASWAAPVVKLWPGQPERVLDRRYAKLSTPVLQRNLLQATREAGVSFVEDTVVAVEERTDVSGVEMASAEVLEAAVVINASGASGLPVPREEERPPLNQSAYGLEIEVDRHGFEMGEMLFMDFASGLLPGAGADPQATFLYAMPLGYHRLFVEETSLVSAQPMAFETLRARLLTRLERMGLTPRTILSEERCIIPMGGSLPRRDQSVLAVGVAGSMVHPATGYQLARTLQTAPRLAEAVATRLGQGDRFGAIRDGWEAIWPARQRRNWELYRFGAEFITELDTDQTRRFFDAFFDLSNSDWQGFLSDRCSTAELARIMTSVFQLATPELRWRLVKAGFDNPRPLLRSLAR